MGFIGFWPATFSEQLQRPPHPKLVSVGPQLFTEAENEEQNTDSAGHEAMTFLDRALREDGEKSVVFVAFGSFFCPPTEEQMDILLTVLENSGLRLLISRVGGGEPIHHIIENRVGRMGDRCLASSWVPQFAVLDHPVRFSGWLWSLRADMTGDIVLYQSWREQQRARGHDPRCTDG